MSAIRDRLESEGFAELPPGDPETPLEAIIHRLESAIGVVAIAPPQRLNASVIGTKGLNTYGGNFGLGELPLHTDLAHWHRPPRYVLLRCVTGSTLVVTTLLHQRALACRISPTIMRRALFSPRRRLDGRMFLLRMLTPELVRWDSLFLMPQNSAARQVTEEMAALASGLPVQRIVLAEPRSALLLDNWRVLHGRGPVPSGERARALDRVYLDAEQHGNEDTA